jgi:hypothetical protein
MVPSGREDCKTPHSEFNAVNNPNCGGIVLCNKFSNSKLATTMRKKKKGKQLDEEKSKSRNARGSLTFW